MKLGIIISTADSETVFNALRLANFAASEGDQVRVFLLGHGVELEQMDDARFNVRKQTEAFLVAGGTIMACETCLKLRNVEGSEMCTLSTMKDLLRLIRESERVVAF